LLYAQYALPSRHGDPRSGHVTAPLALPEKIEIAEYGTVKVNSNVVV